ncbi:hypothetical protein ACHHYP_06099 [Achlya hypogyna]|uniref:Helicase-associated domain-containing protein n=1 Tax=Achlya hypogyna TaxID=1202772 RepID=A0A1V9YVR1_ACHHY|nr:hypothetical protein ACHHYP_06099 [Achlya hypogyna]
MHIEALALYRQLRGNCNVLPAYVVPSTHDWPEQMHSMPLGSVAINLRRSYGSLTSDTIADLDALGFRWTMAGASIHCHKIGDGALFTPLDALVDAFGVFHARHNHCDVPSGFVVPSSDAAWPSEAHGIVLANALPVLRSHFYQLSAEQAKRLHALGLCTELPPWATFVKLLVMHQEQFGSADVARDFTVPCHGNGSASWPREWHGLPLGDLAWHVGAKLRALPKYRRAALATTTFAFNTPATWSRILQALLAFQLEHGHVLVPVSYTVSVEALVAAGLPLGRWVEELYRAQRLHLLPAPTTAALAKFVPRRLELVPRAQRLEAPTASFWSTLLAAVKFYKSSEGHADVPHGYCFPQAATSPVHLRGYALADALEVARQHSMAAARPELEALGILWDCATTVACCDYVHVLDVWLRSVPRVDEAATVSALPSCPVSLAATTIGIILTRLETEQLSPMRRIAFRRLGFDFRERWATKVLALQTFRALHGHLEVPWGFVVPKAQAWNPSTWGLSLGNVIAWMRGTLGTMAPPARRQLSALCVMTSAALVTVGKAALPTLKPVAASAAKVTL